MGPGSHLAKLFKKLGIKAKPGCACLKRAAIMDELGPDWCEQQIELIVDWLAEEAAQRHLPFLRVIGRGVVNMAIRRARKDGHGKAQ